MNKNKLLAAVIAAAMIAQVLLVSPALTASASGVSKEGSGSESVTDYGETGTGSDTAGRTAAAAEKEEKTLIGDLVRDRDTVVLVCPIDGSAPKGRLILPQTLAIRDLLDHGAMPLVCRDTELASALGALAGKPAMVVTDSQAFSHVNAVVPEDVSLTSFSILMARYKGFLAAAAKGVRAIRNLKDGDTVLMAEGCTHHRQCADIGTVRIPNWLRHYTGADIRIETSSGTDFPEDLRPYAAVIHCGGCMLNEREVRSRMRAAQDQGVPFRNYGLVIAEMKGILARSTALFPDLKECLSE